MGEFSNRWSRRFRRYTQMIQQFGKKVLAFETNVESLVIMWISKRKMQALHEKTKFYHR